MKALGIIGGAGPLASSLFYETLIRESYMRKSRFPKMYLINQLFTRGLTLEEGRVNKYQLQRELESVVLELNQHNLDYGIIVCNTLHRYLPIASAKFPFLSIPDIILEEVRSNRHDHILILGTQSTCAQNLYACSSVTSVYPQREQQRQVDLIIDRVLEGKIEKSDSLLLSSIIQGIVKRTQSKGVVLGCTDLPVLHHHYPIECPCFLYDSIKLPITKIISMVKEG